MLKKKLHKNLYKYFISTFAISISLASLQVYAQSSGAPANLSDCVDIDEIDERIACYDTLAGRNERPRIGGSSAPVVGTSKAPVIGESSAPVVKEPSAAVTGTSSAPVVGNSAPVETTSDEKFGLKEPVTKEEKAKNELLASISELKETQPNKRLITLGNGQVWKQSFAKKYRLREGDDIRIYPTGWGNDYRLKVIDQAGYIQVTRLR